MDSRGSPPAVSRSRSTNRSVVRTPTSAPNNEASTSSNTSGARPRPINCINERWTPCSRFPQSLFQSIHPAHGFQDPRLCLLDWLTILPLTPTLSRAGERERDQGSTTNDGTGVSVSKSSVSFRCMRRACCGFAHGHNRPNAARRESATAGPLHPGNGCMLWRGAWPWGQKSRRPRAGKQHRTRPLDTQMPTHPWFDPCSDTSGSAVASWYRRLTRHRLRLRPRQEAARVSR